MQYQAVLLAAALCACSDDPGGDTGVLPADYATTFTEVRDCRRSADHDLNFVRILADDAATGPYLQRDQQFPAGSIVVKEEHDIDDDTCAGPPIGWTIMVSAPDETAKLGWTWHRLREDKTASEAGDARCISCHTSCGQPPDGFLGTCSIP